MHRFQREHPASDNPNGDTVLVPVLSVQAPPVPEENRFYASILDALHSPYRPTESAACRQTHVLKVLKGVGIRLLIIDEVHHIIAGHIGRQRIFLQVLKYLANDLRIPLIAVGTLAAVRAIQSDSQLDSRFDRLPLPLWELDRAFQMLLASFERTLPLRNPSGLAQRASRLSCEIAAFKSHSFFGCS
jgi:hypothetical protein